MRGEFSSRFFCVIIQTLHNGGVFKISAKELTINEDIKAKEVRVVGSDGETLGVMSLDAALNAAYSGALSMWALSVMAALRKTKI